jgi:hypothetical protein
MEMRNMFYEAEGKAMIADLRGRVERWQKETGDEMDLG